MKNNTSVLSLILFLIISVLISCNHQDYLPDPLLQAEVIMNDHPDSASIILQKVEELVPSYSEENQMYYWLLRIQADDKQNIVQPTDSLINQIVSYYQTYGDKEKLMKAYFYQGSVYRDLHDIVKQLYGFLNCIDASKSTQQIELLGQAYGQLGSLYAFMNLYKESKNAAVNALKLYSQANKPKRLAGIYKQLGRIFYATHVPDSAEIYFLKSIQLYDANGYHTNANSSRMELSVLYRDNERLQEADSVLQCLLNEGIKQDLLFLNYANVTSAEEEIDSTKKYLEFIDPTHLNVYGKQQYANLWANYYRAIGDYPNALVEMEKSKELKDSITRYENTSTIGHLQALYNYDKWQSEIEEAQHKNRVNLFMSIIFIICILFAFFVISGHLYHRAEEYRQQSIRFQAIQEQNREIELRQANQLSVHALREAAIGKTFTDDWNDWQTNFEKVFPNFKNNLVVLYPYISAKEILACELIKLDLANVDIARILCLTPSGSTKFKVRIASKISKSNNEKVKLEKIIEAL